MCRKLRVHRAVNRCPGSSKITIQLKVNNNDNNNADADGSDNDSDGDDDGDVGGDDDGNRSIALYCICTVLAKQIKKKHK